ncbi:MAG: MarR family transcriptional regulator [Renibacterium sp.]|nr:MarR family transcriptional regulator [Renibacterium sp.]
MSSENPAGGSPHDILGYLLKHANWRLVEITDAALQPLGIDSKAYGVLRILVWQKPMSQQQVAQTLGVDRTTMVALFDALEAQQIVTRRPDPQDRRRNVVELTDSGRKLFRRADQAYQAAEREFLAPVDAADGEQLRQTLRTLLGE